MHGHNRYKTLPATPTSRPNRYKTLPTQQKTPISAHLARAGRTFSRCRRKLPEQGESFPAGHHSPATQRTLPGTKLSRHPPPQGQTGTKLSPHSPTRTRTLKVACNSITARIRAYSKALESQGSVITARRTHWGIACETAERPEKWAHKTGPVIIHRPRLVSVSSISADASDYQARTERS